MLLCTGVLLGGVPPFGVVPLPTALASPLLVLARVALQIPVVAVTVVLLVALALLRVVLLVPDTTIHRHCRLC